MVARQKRAIASSEGALLIDDLIEWLDERIDEVPNWRALRLGHPAPERIASQVALGYFLPYPVARPIDFEPEQLLREQDSVGWDLVRARAPAAAPSRPTRPDRPTTRSTASRSSSRSCIASTCDWPSSGSTSPSSRSTSSTSRAGTWSATAASTSSASCTRCWTAAREVSDWRPPDAHVVDRQLRLLHLQRLPPARRSQRRGAHRRPQRHGLLARRWSAGTSTRSCSRPAPAGRTAGTTSASAPTSCAPARSRCSASASATRAWATC